MARFSPDQEITLRILPAVAFTFVAYFCIGAPLAILPSYLHLQLGVSTLVAGFLVSLQYIATFASRPRAGHLSDTIGPRRTVRVRPIRPIPSMPPLLPISLLIPLSCFQVRPINTTPCRHAEPDDYNRRVIF